MDTTTILLSVVFGSIGSGLFLYGKRQARPVHILAGLALMVVPFFVPSPAALTIVCAAITALPFVLPL